MAKLPKSFQETDASDEPLAPGDYLAEITSAELKDTKSGTGKYILYVFKVIEGPKKDAAVFLNVNVINDSKAAVAIGKTTNDKLCKALGIDPNKKDLDTDELLKIPLVITVTLRDPNSAYPGNDIKGFKKAGATGAPKKNPFGK